VDGHFESVLMQRFRQALHFVFIARVEVLAAEVDLGVDPVLDHEVDPEAEDGKGNVDLNHGIGSFPGSTVDFLSFDETISDIYHSLQ
jgi:hypothetical protein